MEATARDLRFHSRDIFSAVLRGEEVVLTYRGKPAAMVVPYHPTPKKQGSMRKVFGIWKDHASLSDVATHVRALRKGRFS